jgi:organic hydroperoxide reductase OsmC/OhrA
MPTAYKSFRYKAKTTWTSARRGLLSAVEKPNIVVGSPPEFKGEPDVWTPEELLVGSLNTCIMLTFLSLAQARGLTPAAYESEAEGLLENAEGKFRITEVTVRPHVTVNGEGELERAREIMERAEGECFISNSVKSQVKIIAEFSGALPPK